jgi:hypothetical protein
MSCFNVQDINNKNKLFETHSASGLDDSCSFHFLAENISMLSRYSCHNNLIPDLLLPICLVSLFVLIF